MQSRTIFFVWFIHLFCYLFVVYISNLHIYDYSASVQIDLCMDTPHDSNLAHRTEHSH